MEIETKLHKLGLEGQTTKIGRYTNLNERINEINFSSRDTLVVVGDDLQLSEVINLIGNKRAKPTIGYIPINEETNLTKNLGLPSGENSVMILANRRIENLDMGTCNQKYFLESVNLHNSKISVKINNKFTVTIPDEIDEIIISNLKVTHLKNNLSSVNPHDGLLEVFFLKRKKNLFNNEFTKIHSAFKANRLSIKSLREEFEADLDHVTKIKTPLEVGVLKGGIKMIVGKQRLISEFN